MILEMNLIAAVSRYALFCAATPRNDFINEFNFRPAPQRTVSQRHAMILGMNFPIALLCYVSPRIAMILEKNLLRFAVYSCAQRRHALLFINEF